jgi:para-aminobenzoate synthetase / 4-amino-4-deoxychorismate lyase
LKARFLTGLDPGFELFETMLAASEEAGARPVVHHLDRHLARMAHSARVLGFGFDPAEAKAALAERTLALTPGTRWRLRLALRHDGRLQLQHAPLAALASETVMLRVTDERLPRFNPLAAHKTTLRRMYDEGVRAAEACGAFDSLFFSEDGRLVEGGRTSVFLKIEGRWCTPPVSDGALPGVMRACLLEDGARWGAVERSMTIADLRRAEAVVVCNALRGALPAQLLHQAVPDSPVEWKP